MTIGPHLHRIWWLGGLALFLALFGHDALMASAPYPDPVSRPANAAQAAVADDHAAGSEVGHPENQRLPEHPSDCGTTGVAVPCLGNQQDMDGLAAPQAATPAVVNAEVLLPNPLWTEPFWPPGTRRALLQVYRI